MSQHSAVNVHQKVPIFLVEKKEDMFSANNVTKKLFEKQALFITGIDGLIDDASSLLVLMYL